MSAENSSLVVCFFARRLLVSAGAGRGKMVENWMRWKDDWRDERCVFYRWIWKNRKKRLCDRLELEDVNYHLMFWVGAKDCDGT